MERSSSFIFNKHLEEFLTIKALKGVHFIKYILLSFLLLLQGLHAQEIVEWDGVYQLEISDFQSKGSRIGGTDLYSLHTASNIDFAYAMNSAVFMFTKNFNSKVSCSFDQATASLIAPDTLTANNLLAFARYSFDLSELYARKLRKKLYESKGAFSQPNFFEKLFQENQRELTARYTDAGEKTNLGVEGMLLKMLHQEVLDEIDDLSDFCKSCKPVRK